MGYQPDDAAQQTELDRLKLQEDQQKEKTDENPDKEKVKKSKKKKGQTKEEQDELLKKMSVYAVRGEAKPLEEQATAMGMDFSKSIDDQDSSVNKEVLSFPTDCYGCGKPGFARMCIADIPFFKEIIIMAFSCDFCGYRNTEIKSGGGISDSATKIVVTVNNVKDLDRDVFKSDSCVLAIPSIDFAMAPGTLGSMYTTLEGLISQIVTALTENNPFGVGDSATNNKYKAFLEQLDGLK